MSNRRKITCNIKEFNLAPFETYFNAPKKPDVVLMQGPQGPQGPEGPEGPEGKRGATGATGATGADDNCDMNCLPMPLHPNCYPYYLHQHPSQPPIYAINQDTLVSLINGINRENTITTGTINNNFTITTSANGGVPSVITSEANKPSIPTEIEFVSTVDPITKKIDGTLSWIASSPETTKTKDTITIVEYDISYSAVSLNRFTPLAVEQNNIKTVDTKIDFTELNPDTKYTFEIQAKNSDSKLSGYSSAVEFFTSPLIPKELQYTIPSFQKGVNASIKDISISNNDVSSKIIKILANVNPIFNFTNTIWPIQSLETRGNKYNTNPRKLQIKNSINNSTINTPLSEVQLPGFEIFNQTNKTFPPASLSNNSITLNGTYADAYPITEYSESYQQFYMDLLINSIVIPAIKFTPSINSQTLSITDLSNNKTILSDYYYDGTYNYTGPAIDTTYLLASSVDDTTTSITKINGIEVYYNLSLNIQTRVSNIGTYFYRSPVLQYYIDQKLIINENNLDNLITEDKPINNSNMIKPQVNFNNLNSLKVKIADINTTNISSVTNTTPTVRDIRINIIGYNAFYNSSFNKTITLLHIIDQPSYNLAYKTIKSTLTNSNIDKSFNNSIPFRTLSSIYDSTTVLTSVLTNVTNLVPYDNTQVLNNNSNNPIYNNELPIINGGFCFPGIYTNENTPDKIRYVTYAWKMAAITSGANILSFLLDCNEAISIENAPFLNILTTIVSNTILDIQINVISIANSIDNGIRSQNTNYFGRWIYGSISEETDPITNTIYNSISSPVDNTKQYFLNMDTRNLSNKTLSYSLPKSILLDEGQDGYILLRIGMKQTNFQINSIKASIL